VLAAVLLHRSTGASLPGLTLLRVVIAAAAAFALGRFWPTQGALGTMLESVVIGIVFLMVLVATREFGSQDLQAVLSLAKEET
jgi:stage V sporulation protein B